MSLRSVEVQEPPASDETVVSRNKWEELPEWYRSWFLISTCTGGTDSQIPHYRFDEEKKIKWEVKLGLLLSDCPHLTKHGPE